MQTDFMHISEFFKRPNLGLLIIRLVLGATFIAHGLMKFLGGTAALESVGSAMQSFGITAFPVFFGGIAALCELLGGLLILIGYKFRFGAFALFLVMFVAAYTQFNGVGSFMKFAWALEMAAVFFGLIFIGPGKYSIDKQ